MNEEQERRAKAIIIKQLAMNEATLDTLRRAGLKPDAVVQLDFMFVAPSQVCAESLKARLEENDCLDVEVKEQPVRECLVTGKSHPTTLTSEVLRDWIKWMVVQGVVENCEFDGWGTEVPGSEV